MMKKQSIIEKLDKSVKQFHCSPYSVGSADLQRDKLLFLRHKTHSPASNAKGELSPVGDLKD